MNPDRLAELEEERRFLLRSLDDLEREHAAGDVDDVDYRELRDGYTVRAAATLREIDDGRRALPEKPPANWRRRLVTIVGVVVAIAVVSWALIASSAERKAGQEQTGLDPRDARQVLMAEARSLQLGRPGEAAAIYAQVLQLDADDVVALTYFGWTLAVDAQQRRVELGAEADSRFAQAVEVLDRAATLDPAYPDPRCFLAIVEFRFRDDAATASPWLEACLEGNPPADVRRLVEPMAVDIADALS
jgi:tetratricopeptide (TPR) repeat protein